MGNNKLLKGLSAFMAVIAAVIGIASVVSRVGGYITPRPAPAIAEAEENIPAEEPMTESTAAETRQEASETTPGETETQPATSSGKNYPVIEKKFESDGITYDNFSVKNTTDFQLNVEEELSKKPDFEIDDSHRVQALIFHTHACESYLTEDTGYYPRDFYPRTTDDRGNVTAVGDRIAMELKKAGIGVIHDKTHHDYPSFNGSYERSYETIQKYMNKYEGIKVVLDIHRDSIGEGGEAGKVKPVFNYGGKKAAQIMIMTGYDYEGGGYFPFWEENLRFALRLQQTAETMYPGITRPLSFGEYTYNLNVCNGSLLIEVGTEVNTLDEVKRTGTMLGKALVKVLQNY